MIKVGIIGIGAMGKNHLRVYNDLDNVEIIGISDLDKENLNKFSKKYNVPAYFDYKELIALKPDIVSIAVPTIFHHKIAIECLKENINVLLEKPISGNIEEAKEIIEAAKKSKSKLMIAHIERFNPAIIELKKRINDVGKIIKIEAKRIGPYPSRIDDVGVTVDLSVHDIDIMNYITEEKVADVFATKIQKIHSKFEDLVVGVLKFENGVIGIIDTNWLTPTKVRELRVLGEKGMFLVNYLTQDLTFYENNYVEKDYDYADIMRGVTEGKTIKYPVNKKEPLRSEIEHFIDCVKSDKEPLIKGEDGLNALDIALKMSKS